ncbi:MAG: oxygenase MpaB family protein, partial [Acidimicrobiia bacterium]
MTEDQGLFGPGSMTWRVHSSPTMLVGGLRALLLQALHPTAMAAVASVGGFASDPWGRLKRTREYLRETVFGDTATAERAGERVQAVHRRIEGVDPVTGRHYRADDPDLLLWVHATEVDSFLRALWVYGSAVSEEDADRYVAEQVRAAALVGLEGPEVPATNQALRDYLRSFPGLALTPAGRVAMRFVLHPPLPVLARPLWALQAAAAVAILPRRCRQLYGLPWSPVADPPLRLAVRGTYRALELSRRRASPQVMRQGRAERA